MDDPLAIAKQLSIRAGRLINTNLSARKKVDYKGAVDLVTSVDRECEELITSGLRAAFPDHAIVAEETGGQAPPEGPCWYVDPIDGTCNFVHGIPHCAVSIALLTDGRPEVAVVCDPARDEVYEARRGNGSRCNGKPVHVSPTAELDRSLLVTGFPYDRRGKTGFYLSYFEAFLQRAQDLRRLGSAALDLCWVAAGRFDGFFELGLKPWDTAAGWLILEEAGGQVSDFDGGPYGLWGDSILATNGRIHQECRQLLATIQRPTL